MTKGQFDAMEKRFGIRLPNAYRNLVMSTPPELLALLKVSDETYDESQSQIYRDIGLIRSTNDWVRDADGDFTFDENSSRRRWPKKYFVIGGDVGGNLYCVLPQSTKVRVFHWQHDDTEFEPCGDSIEEFVKYLFDLYCRLALMDL